MEIIKEKQREYVITASNKNEDFNSFQIKNSSDAANYLKSIWPEISVRESFICLALDRANNVIGYFILSQGGVSQTIVDSKIFSLFVKFCAETIASSIIVSHNHPSENIVPSANDIRITKKLQVICDILESELLDHIIVTENSHYSFVDEGRMENVENVIDKIIKNT